MASAVILAPAALACIWFGGIAYQVLIVVIAAGLAVEWVHLCGRRIGDPGGAAVLAGTVTAPIWAAAGMAMVGVGMLAAAAVWLLAGPGGWTEGPSAAGSHALSGGDGPALRDTDQQRVAAVAAQARPLVTTNSGRCSPSASDAPHPTPTGKLPLLFGLPYIGLGAVAMIWLRADPAAGRADLLFILPLIWASDIGAYLAGRLVGGPRLAPRISPGKTWSGAAGGLAAAIAVALVSATFLSAPASLGRVACLAAALGIIAQAGDLLESRIKRHFGVKDSSHLIPGHGGLLDRLDAVLTVAPIAAMLALAAGPGVVLWQ